MKSRVLPGIVPFPGAIVETDVDGWTNRHPNSSVEARLCLEPRMAPANQPALLLQPHHCSARHRSAIGCRSQGRKCKAGLAGWRRNLTPPPSGRCWRGPRGMGSKAVEKGGRFRNMGWAACFLHLPSSPMTLLPWHRLRRSGNPRPGQRGPGPRNNWITALACKSIRDNSPPLRVTRGWPRVVVPRQAARVLNIS